ncbi:hypothetical protein, partial [Streptococcus mitis]|uniref:hypothetical protein n=1 Tax=Streptococcus mitis TaxID=28037 RepID=UPI001E452337
LKHKKISDKHKTGGINVYTFIFLRKNIRINIYELSEKALGAFPFSLFRTNHVRTSALRIADVSPHKSENSIFQI